MAQTNQVPTGSPSKTSNHERLRECYERGMHLSTVEKNYEYAHAMFAECMLHDFGNQQFAEAMIQNLRAKTPIAKKSLFNLRRGGSRPLKQALQDKDWTTIVRIGIELLYVNPWNITTLRTMAEACAALHHNEVELVFLKQALDGEPKNVQVNRHCARSLGRMGQFDQAIACWHRVEKLRGKDEEAAKMIANLALERLKYPGGRPPMLHKSEAVAKVPEPEETPQDVVLSPQQELEQAIAQDPQNTANYCELADLLLASNQFDRAETVLTRAIAACGEETELVEQLQKVRSLRAERQRKLDERRELEKQIANAPFRVPWLELVLLCTLMALVFQLVPSTTSTVLRLIDIRNWSRVGWFVFQGVVLLLLIGIRYAPSIRAYTRRRQIRRMHQVLNAKRVKVLS